MKLRLTVTDDQGAPLAADEVTASYILPSGDSKLERWADTGAVDVTLEASTEYMTLGLAATKAGYTSGKKQVDIPGTVAVGEGRALAVSKNETGDLRKGTISMQWHNIEASEITAYDVEVSQEP